MKKKNLRSYASLGDIAVRKVDAKARTVDVIASTESEDSHGTVIDQASWKLDRFQRNPVVLLEHGSGAGFFGADAPEDRLPIARAEDVRVEGGQLKARIVFPGAGRNELSDAVWMAIEDGRVGACSVGFMPGKVVSEEVDGHEHYRLLNCTLYEISICALPSNPDCVAERSLLSEMAGRGKIVDCSMDGCAGPKDCAATGCECDCHGGRSIHTQTTTAPIATPPETRMNLAEVIARMLACSTDETSIVAELEKLKARAVAPVAGEVLTVPSFDEERAALTGRAEAAQASLRSIVESLGLAADAPVADASKAIATLTARSAKADEIEPLLASLTERIAQHDVIEAAREVEFLIARGKAYDLSYDERSRKALAAYRKADPKGFAEDHKAALDGLRAFDDPKLFARVAGGETGVAATTVDEQASRPVFGADVGNVDMHRKADELQKSATEKGAPITRSAALEQARRAL